MKKRMTNLMKLKNELILFLFPLICAVYFVHPVQSAGVAGKNGMVVTAHPIASEFGLEVLQSGGNAIDAAVGAAIVAGVVEPNASGLGGGGAMLIYLHNLDSLTYINYYACAPQALREDLNPWDKGHAGESVLVPGTVAGLYYALKNYGTIGWGELLNRAIKKVEPGFPINENLHRIILDSYEKILSCPQTSEIYLRDQLPPIEGAILKNEKLIATLKKLAQYGPDIFYQGEIADSIDAVMRRNGGVLRKSDLSQFKIRELKPLIGSYRGHKIVSAPAPQSGSTLIESLNIFEIKDLSKMGDFTQYASTFHFMAEALRRADADRQDYLGDPNFVSVPSDILISKKFATDRYATINFDKAEPDDPRKTPAGNVDARDPNQQGNTTHISIVDKQGNAVSLTQTLNHFWGSGISVCGFLLNNGMTSFGGNQVNSMEPGKQPRSTIAPTLVFKNNRLAIVVGTPGAHQIISTLSEVICNVIDFDKSAEKSNNDPRFCARKSINSLPMENRFSTTLVDSLKAFGHPVQIFGEMDLYFGGVQLVVVDTEKNIYYGSSDPRRSGMAKGY